MRKQLYIWALATLFTPLTAWAAGTVLFSSGEAYRTHQTGTEVLRAGQTVRAGDHFQTGQNGFLYIRLDDEGLFILRPNSQGSIAAFTHDPSNAQKNEVKLELQRGTARVVTGKAAKVARDRFRLNTPVAAIGVRGTDFTVFTNDGVTRAAINSGAIVVSNFNQQCSRDALGPCANAAALTLAAQDKIRLVEVRSDLPNPKLLENEQLNPEKTAPRGPQEPKAQGTVTDSNLAVNKDPLLLENALKVEALPQRAVNWGRWQAIAQIPAETDLLKTLRESPVELIALSPYFAITRPNTARTDLPTAGQVSFTLKAQDAYFIQNNLAEAASASNASLTLDFGARRFNTQLDVSSPNYRTTVSGSGSLEANGTFTSDPLNSSRISGGLGGTLNNEAAYLYQKRVSDGLIVHGATYWSR